MKKFTLTLFFMFFPLSGFAMDNEFVLDHDLDEYIKQFLEFPLDNDLNLGIEGTFFGQITQLGLDSVRPDSCDSVRVGGASASEPVEQLDVVAETTSKRSRSTQVSAENLISREPSQKKRKLLSGESVSQTIRESILSRKNSKKVKKKGSPSFHVICLYPDCSAIINASTISRLNIALLSHLHSNCHKPELRKTILTYINNNLISNGQQVAVACPRGCGTVLKTKSNTRPSRLVAMLIKHIYCTRMHNEANFKKIEQYIKENGS